MARPKNIPSDRKGKTLEEIYGVEKAESIKEKLRKPKTEEVKNKMKIIIKEQYRNGERISPFKEKWKDEQWRNKRIKYMQENSPMKKRESREKLSKFMIEKYKNNPELGKTLTQKAHEKIRNSYNENNEWAINNKRNASERLKKMRANGRIKSWNQNLKKETDERVRKNGKNISKTRNKLRAEGKLKVSDETKQKLKVFNLGKHHTEAAKEKIRASNLKKWSNQKYKENTIRATIKGNNIKPNKPESNLFNLIREIVPNEYKLNVLGDTIINGRIPDFINCNGQKKVINLNGVYWHQWKFQEKMVGLTREIIEQTERKPYEELGFKVLIIWEDELKDIDKIKERIINFNK